MHKLMLSTRVFVQLFAHVTLAKLRWRSSVAPREEIIFLLAARRIF